MDANTSAEFEEYAKSNNMVWKHFLRSTDHQIAKCKLCHVVIKTTGRTTTGLHTHLRTKHGIDTKLLKSDDTSKSMVLKSTPNDDNFEAALATTSKDHATTVSADIRPQSTRKRKITDYFQVIDSVPMRVSRMVAKDGIDFKVFANSETMRYLFENAGDTLPESIDAIKEMVINDGSAVKKQLKGRISKLKTQNGQKFCITLNEWTATGNRRFLNLNVHTNVEGSALIWDIGLIRITECLPAELCLKLIKHKLQEFGLDLDADIVAITTCCTQVMNKVARLVGPIQQLCWARTIQDTILDVFYARKNDTRPKHSEESSSDSSDSGGLEMSWDKNEKFIVTTNSPFDEELQMVTPEYTNLRKKLRRIVSMFKKCQSKNTLLQNYVTQMLGSELQLTSDKKGRWDSLVLLIERFLKIKSSISKVQTDLKLEPEFCLSEEEFSLLKEMYEILQMIQVVTERICKDGTNLITAHRLLSFTINKLVERKSDISQQLASSLQIKMKQRDTTLTGVLMYLNTPRKCINDKAINIAMIPNEPIIVKEIGSLLQRLLCLRPVASTEDETGDGIQDGDNPDSDDPLASVLSLVKPEQNVDEEAVMDTDEDKASNIDRITLELEIKREIAAYESGGQRGKYLDLAYNYLSNIPPVGMKAEAAFVASATGNSIECNLDDDTVDVLFLLRNYFLGN